METIMIDRMYTKHFQSNIHVHNCTNVYTNFLNGPFSGPISAQDIDFS